MNYARAIRIARALSGLQQRELAAKSGVDPSLISLLEVGRRKPTTRTIAKIADALEMPTHLLTMLAAEQRDLKNISESEIRVLGELLARALKSDEEKKEKKTKRKSTETRPKAPSVGKRLRKTA